MVGALATDVVRSVRRHSDTVDQTHAVLIQLTALAADLALLERLQHEPPYGAADVQKTEYVAAHQHAALNIATLERLIPADSPWRAELRLIAKLVEGQRARFLSSNESNAQDRLAGPPQTARAVWISPTDNIQGLVAMGLTKTLELERRKATEQVHLVQIRNWAMAIGIVACLLGALLMGVIRHDLALQGQVASRLAKANDELDVKVKERTAELAKANQLLRKFSAHIEAAREEERVHIARDVHDALGSTLTALKLELSGSLGNDRLPSVERPRCRRASVDLVDSALQTVEDLVTELRPGVLDKFGLWEALRWKTGHFEERMRIPCHLSMAPDLPLPSNDASTGIFRVVEEALTNVARHADASRVDVVVSLQGGNLEVEISDNGRGIAQEQLHNPNSFGLLGMDERARLLGGEFHITGNVGSGTTARLCVPVGKLHESNQA